ncbi:LysR family transcriptional regulator [Nguyenibacter vanlangensis]|uniref:LysR family transcriptional regulator n=1 Tax=Nguyenibacter vanlangensis TaxID=1216886 RepID=A0A7Y7IXL1_9PROT|nr:LysR family transcriptional regulator [Nguyenibacter vanlangensis]NVN11716.1 LysR family transcriptional regulator [Nguyenibacter vanlangensis]
MNNRRIDLNLATIFLALWYERSVSGAAVRLALTQPAVSNALKRLRTACGDELFVRTRGGMRPTVRATMMAPQLERDVEQIRLALGGSRDFLPETATRQFVVGMTAGLDLAAGPVLSAMLWRAAPLTMTRFRAPETRQAADLLERRDIELAATIRGLPDHRCAEMTVGRYHFVCLYDPAGCGLGPVIGREEFLDVPHILTEAATRGTIVETMLRQEGLRRRVRVVVSNFGALPAFLLGQYALAVVPHYVGYALARQSGLHVSPLPVPITGGEVHILMRLDGLADAGLIWLRLQLAEALRMALADGR